MKKFYLKCAVAIVITCLCLGQLAAKEVVILSEDFNVIAADGEFGTSGSTANGKLDLGNSGWSAENGYAAAGVVKLGSSSKMGKLVTPSLEKAKAGAFTMTFKACTWDGDKTDIKILLNDLEIETVTGLPEVDSDAGKMKTFTVTGMLTGATDKIAFVASAASKKRFFIDDVVVTQIEADGTPTISAVSSLDFGAVESGGTKSLSLDIMASDLTDDISVHLSDEINFTTSGELTSAGGSLTVAYRPSVMGNHKATLTLTSSGAESVEVELIGTCKKLSASDIAELRSLYKEGDNTVYTFKGTAIVTLSSSSRNVKYIQDDSGAILIDDASGIIQGNYVSGDEIALIQGTLSEYFGMLQFVPVSDAVKGESGKKVIAEVKNPSEIAVRDQGKLIQVKGVEFVETGVFEISTNYSLSGYENLPVRIQYNDLACVGQNIPVGKQDITGVVLVYERNGESQTQLVPVEIKASETVSMETDMVAETEVYAANGYIYVKGAIGTEIEVYNQQGVLVQKTFCDSQKVSVALAKGLYIVKTKGVTHKVVLF
ncbi:DUF6383 domain-containing protein [Coprobacter secundus]|uniref:DUF6383 domain-containing protein n=1 Tax=Coprobacter secundus TaxID=1501392 RepID=UPI003521CBDA